MTTQHLYACTFFSFQDHSNPGIATPIHPGQLLLDKVLFTQLTTSLLFDSFALNFTFLPLLFKYDSHLIYSTLFLFFISSFPHTVVSISLTATNAAKRWQKTFEIVYIEFERCIITDVWFVFCLSLIIWRRWQQWCMGVTFHMRWFLKCRQWSFFAETQQQYHCKISFSLSLLSV